MKRMIIIMFFGFMLNGCASTATPEHMERYINDHRYSKHMRNTEVMLDVPYKEAFTIVDQRMGPNVLKADYANKAILCNWAQISERLHVPIVAYFEEEGPNRTKVTLKGKGLASMPFLTQQLKDDAELRKKQIR